MIRSELDVCVCVCVYVCVCVCVCLLANGRMCMFFQIQTHVRPRVFGGMCTRLHVWVLESAVKDVNPDAYTFGSLAPESLGIAGAPAGAKGLVRKSVGGDALGQPPPENHSAKEGVGGKNYNGATRKLLARLLSTASGSSSRAKLRGARGGGDGNVSVTILKWNSRVAVGVMDLKALTIGAEAALHPVFVPMPANWRGKDTTGEKLNAQQADADIPRSSRQLTAARHLAGADPAGAMRREAHSEGVAAMDHAVDPSFHEASQNLRAVGSSTRHQWGSWSSVRRNLLSTVEKVFASGGSSANVVLTRNSRNMTMGESGAKSGKKSSHEPSAKSKLGSEASGQQSGSERKVGRDGDDGGPWVPCMPAPVRNEGNNTATISFATGCVQDPCNHAFVIICDICMHCWCHCVYPPSSLRTNMNTRMHAHRAVHICVLVLRR